MTETSSSVEQQHVRKSSNTETRPLKALNAMLIDAAKVGDIDTAKRYILLGADVNCHKDDGVTPLFVAAEVGNRGMVHFLLTQPEIDPDIQGTFHRTPLHAAVSFGYLSSAKMLLRHKANPNIGDSFGRTPLHTSIRTCNLPMTTLLVRNGANVNLPDIFGNMPLYLAMIEVCNPDQTRFLLRNGALPNLRSPRGNAVLFDCVLDLDPDIQNEVVHMLIRYGGRVNIGNPLTHRTPLHDCAFVNNVELSKFLLRMGANPVASSSNGLTPLSVALEQSNWEIYEELSDAVYHLDSCDGDDLTYSKKIAGPFGSLSTMNYRRGSKIKKNVRFHAALKARIKLNSNSKSKSKLNSIKEFERRSSRSKAEKKQGRAK